MPRQYYSASEAARTLGISLDTLRRWDRQGRIKTKRDAGNRRIVSAKEIERLRGGPRAEHQMSARNRFNGIVRDVKIEGLMAQVEMVVTEPAVLTAIVTADAVAELGLKAGNHVVAVIKSTSVMVEH
jgi:molybdopterin-binding protein